MAARREGTLSSVSLSGAEIEAPTGQRILDADRLDRIEGVTTWDYPAPRRVLFLEKFDLRIVEALRDDACPNLLVVAVPAYASEIDRPRLITEHPRSLFAAIVRALFSHRLLAAQDQPIHPTAHIAATASLSVGVTVGPDCVVGEYAVLRPNVVLAGGVTIGDRCIIGSGTVIGEPGFGIYRDEAGVPRRFPQVAGAIIGDDVELGALNTVAGGTIHPTQVDDHVKTDDHVYIAHNCHVGARTLLTASVVLAGSVRIGMDCWVGPNASVRDGLIIGDGAFIGIGSVVTRPVPAGETVYGVPAKPRGRTDG